MSIYENIIITGDFNAHSSLWHSSLNDQRGNVLVELINHHNLNVINTNNHTRQGSQNKQSTSPDISLCSNSLQNNIDWSTNLCTSSDHLLITIQVNVYMKT